MLAVWRPSEAGTLLCESVQWSHQGGKVLNITSTVVCQSHELLHLTSALWHWPGGNPFGFGRVNCNPLLQHNVAQIAHLLAAEVALGWLQPQSGSLQTAKNINECLKVTLKGPPKYDDVVKIDQALIPLKSTQHSIHEALECCWCITESEGHHIELKQAIWCTKSSLVFISFTDLYLPVATG